MRADRHPGVVGRTGWSGWQSALVRLSRASQHSKRKSLRLQRFLSCNKASVAEARAAFACLSARFSFSDFPDFFVMDCRGDLSAIADPLIMGPDWSRIP